MELAPGGSEGILCWNGEEPLDAEEPGFGAGDQWSEKDSVVVNL